MNGHSVVPIGGAPFIRPYENARALDHSATHHAQPAFLTTSSPTRSPPSNWNSLLPSHSSSISSPLSSASSSPTSSASSSSFSPPTTNSQLEAALKYSSALHQHTRNMWEKERSSIEKLKLESSSHHHTDDGRRSSQSAASSSSSAAAAANANADRNSSVDINRRSSLGSTFGVDNIFGRKRRHQKNKSIY